MRNGDPGVSVRRHWLPVLLLLFGGVAPAAAQHEPPRIGGVALGNLAQGVRSTLGKPDREQTSLGMRFWDYSRRGLTVIWREGDRGVQGIVVTRPNAGDVSGVKVGDPTKRVRDALGAPARVRQEGRFLDYIGTDWVLSIQLHQGSVTQITLLRAGASAP